MKFLTLYFAIGMICLTDLSRAQSAKNAIRRETTPSLIDTIEAILTDPEFQSLRPQQQLRVLLLIYDFLEKHFKNKTNADKNKRSMNSK